LKPERSKVSQDTNSRVKLGSFDIIGSRSKAVAIIEIPDDKWDLRHLIAAEILKRHKNVKSVLAKVSPRVGVERLRKYILLAGNHDTTVIHKEYGYLLKLDPTKVYFSPREAEERIRIASQVKPGEKVLVMFAGVGPFCIAIAKKQPKVQIVYGVEINKAAFDFFKENIKLNKLEGKVKAFLGDVRDICPKFDENFDRIVMPLPKGAEVYLDIALEKIRDGGTIHFYNWGAEPNPYKQGIEKILSATSVNGYSAKILGKRLVSQYSPRVWKVRIDFQVYKVSNARETEHPNIP